MGKIKFGTDGWRAVIAEDFTFDNVRKVAQGLSDYINSNKDVNSPKVVVGYDTRFLSDQYARLICEVLAANRIKVLFTQKPSPTPAVTLAIKSKRLQGGIVVTASHNPPKFNGIKFKTKEAAPADEKVTDKIELFIARAQAKFVDFNKAVKTGYIKFVDLDADYLNFIRGYVSLNVIKKAKPNILVDYMHGAGAGYIENVLKGIGCRIQAIRAERNPLFGGVNPEPIPRNLAPFLKKAKQDRVALGIALDGDADRIGAAGSDGRYINSGQIISLILFHFFKNKKLTGSVVKTISGTTLLERIADDFKLPLKETPIGFKYISRLMLEEDVLIGGEESGGIGFKGYIPERDGILSGLLLLELVSVEKKSIDKILKELSRRYGNFYYDRIDLEFPINQAKAVIKCLMKSPPGRLLNKKIVKIKKYDGIKFIMKDDSWLLLRPSGTEPVMRIYAEGSSNANVKRLLKLGKQLIRIKG